MSLSTNAGSRSANDYTANELRAQTILDAPTYANVADAPQEGGLVVYVDGSGADGDTPGHYCHDGSGYVRVGSGSGGSGSAGIDIENTDGTTLLAEANPIQAGTDLSWTDDGDGSATLDFAGTSSAGIDIENTDGTTLLAEANPIQAGSNLNWTDDGDGSATLDATDTNTDTDTRTDLSDSGGVVVSDTTDATFTASDAASVSVTADGDGTGTVDIAATDTDTNTQAYSLAASGSATLSSGSATVDTGVATDSNLYTVNFNPGAADIAVSLDGSGTNYQLHFSENNTSVGNPTVDWQLSRSEL
jgi:hypothetical protein